MMHLSQTIKRCINAENLIWILWPRRVLLWKLSQVDLYGDSLGPCSPKRGIKKKKTELIPFSGWVQGIITCLLQYML